MPLPAARIPWPRPPQVPARQPFPLVAVLAPMVLSLALWVVTESAMSLIFAAVGPAIALGSLADAWRTRRRSIRRENARFAADVATARQAIDDAHGQEMALLAATIGEPIVALTGALTGAAAASRVWRAESSALVLIGHAPRASDLRVPELLGAVGGSDIDAAVDSRVADDLADLMVHATVLLAAPLAIDAHGGIAVVGPRPLADAFARTVIMHLSAMLSPAQFMIIVGGGAGSGADGRWTWVQQLPHDISTDAHDALPGGHELPERARFTFVDARGGVPQVVVTIATNEAGIVGAHTHVVEARTAGEFVLRSTGSPPVSFAPIFASQEQAIEWAEQSERLSEQRGIRAPSARLPGPVRFDDLPRAGVVESGLSARFCVSSAGPIDIDLADAGPHAVVAGVTGSGKSELLSAWILAMASGRSPDDLTFLLVDFKGGAHFEPLAALAHTVGVITDLDTASAERALASLRAEVLRRESLLRSLGAQSIDDERAAGALPRLVVVVDEFGVVADQLPELHSLFVDLAARGRSLGIHLILCTQRVSGVVRDSVMANCPLRLCLRVTAAADSLVMIGTSGAAELPPGERGLVLVARVGEPPTLARVARSESSDMDVIVERSRGVAIAHRPWCAPLPELIALRELRSPRNGDPPDDNAPQVGDPLALPFAVADRPELQSQPTVSLNIPHDLPLLVLGAARSGRSSTLNAVAAAIDHASSAIVVARAGVGGAAAWDLVEGLLAVARAAEQEPDARVRCIGLIDDLDDALVDLPAEYQSAFIERVDSLLRASGVSLVASARALTGGLQSLAPHFAAPVILRMPTRLDHAAAGEPGATFDAGAPPGRARWRGILMQVALADPTPDTVLRGGPATRPVSDIADYPVTLAVSTRPRWLAARLRDSLGSRARVIDLTTASSAALSEITQTDDRNGALSIGSVTVYVADPDTWQAQWTLLGRLRHSSAMLFDACSVADVRAITRSRDLPPPFPSARPAAWLREPDGPIHRLTVG